MNRSRIYLVVGGIIALTAIMALVAFWGKFQQPPPEESAAVEPLSDEAAIPTLNLQILNPQPGAAVNSPFDVQGVAIDQPYITVDVLVTDLNTSVIYAESGPISTDDLGNFFFTANYSLPTADPAMAYIEVRQLDPATGAIMARYSNWAVQLNSSTPPIVTQPPAESSAPAASVPANYGGPSTAVLVHPGQGARLTLPVQIAGHAGGAVAGGGSLTARLTYGGQVLQENMPLLHWSDITVFKHLLGQAEAQVSVDTPATLEILDSAGTVYVSRSLTLKGYDAQTNVQVYFLLGGAPNPVTRVVPATAPPLRFALEDLFWGPTAAERAAGYDTALPRPEDVYSAGLRERVMVHLVSLEESGGTVNITVTGEINACPNPALAAEQIKATVAANSTTATMVNVYANGALWYNGPVTPGGGAPPAAPTEAPAPAAPAVTISEPLDNASVGATFNVVGQVTMPGGGQPVHIRITDMAGAILYEENIALSGAPGQSLPYMHTVTLTDVSPQSLVLYVGQVNEGDVWEPVTHIVVNFTG